MPECHACQHNLKPQLKSLPWEQTPCSTCEPTLSNKGASHVSIDAEPWIGPITQPVEPMSCFDVDGIADAAKFDREALVDGLKVILELMQSNPVTAQIVIYRIIHPHQIKLIEKALGMGKHAIKRRLVRALRRWPKLSAFVSVRKKQTKGRA